MTSRRHERRARIVAGVSLGVMLIELAAGLRLNSMALISDGLHTFTHFGVMVTAASAYAFARRRADDPRFTFGTGKVTDLAAFANGVGLAVLGLVIGLESLGRFFRPEPVALGEAAGVAVLGLLTGLLSAALLHQPGTSHERYHQRRDLNLWAAYLHMVADVITSVLAIIALVAGAALGWVELDSVVGMVNAAVVASFAVRLIRSTSAALLDMAPGPQFEEVRRRLESDGARALDLRLWRVGGDRLALSVRMASPLSHSAAHYRERLRDMPGLAHVVIELEPVAAPVQASVGIALAPSPAPARA